MRQMITKNDLKLFLRQVNTLEELSEGSLYRGDWWETTRNIRSRTLYRILKVAATRYDALTIASNGSSLALHEHLRQEGAISKRKTHELKHAPKGTDLVALADGIVTEERGNSQPIAESFKEFRDQIKSI